MAIVYCVVRCLLVARITSLVDVTLLTLVLARMEVLSLAIIVAMAGLLARLLSGPLLMRNGLTVLVMRPYLLLRVLVGARLVAS